LLPQLGSGEDEPTVVPGRTKREGIDEAKKIASGYGAQLTEGLMEYKWTHTIEDWSDEDL